MTLVWKKWLGLKVFIDYITVNFLINDVCKIFQSKIFFFIFSRLH